MCWSIFQSRLKGWNLIWQRGTRAAPASLLSLGAAARAPCRRATFYPFGQFCNVDEHLNIWCDWWCWSWYTCNYIYIYIYDYTMIRRSHCFSWAHVPYSTLSAISAKHVSTIDIIINQYDVNIDTITTSHYTLDILSAPRASKSRVRAQLARARLSRLQCLSGDDHTYIYIYIYVYMYIHIYTYL